LALIGPALVFGCAGASGDSGFSAVAKKAGTPRPGMSRVVLYPTRDADATTFQLDGVLLGQLKPGTYVYRDVPVGGHELVAEPPGTGKLERFAFTTPSGRTVYLKVDATDLAKWTHEAAARTSTGLYGGMGPRPEGTARFKFVKVDEATAARELADMILLSN